ncbi:Anti-sigma-E factor RseA [Vibrio palustris]|uniref:Anti-sigma-E factor RseA n=2 Tax=Vibrio palustris TaxID=1918946 RepID=A0A1R4B8J6_9VIBR|nr:Anti-sigma-E factor RseA [Vibrio palustris]
MVDIMADKEKLSALMDGEMIDKSLIQELEADRDSLDTWKHYHLIGDVLRGDAPQKAEWNIAESVALALENEPTHNQHSAHAHEAVPIEAQPQPTKVRRQLPGWLSQLGQVGVAACVSLVVILGVQQYGGEDQVASMPQNDQIPVLKTIPLSGTAEPVSLTRNSVHRQGSEENMQVQRRRVNALLQDYELQLRLNSERQAASHDAQ